MPTANNFVLTHFNSGITLTVAGDMTRETTIPIDASACAVLHVTLVSMQNTFKFETDASNVNDISGSDLKFYVHAASFPELQPSNAKLDDAVSLNPIATSDANGSYASADMMLKHDYIRYLALHLFNTPNGVDLFNNVDALKSNIELKCGSSTAGNTWYDVSAALFNVDVSGSNVGLVGTAGSKYMLDDPTDPTNANLCRELLMQMIDSDNTRFSTTVDIVGQQSLPFVSGDSISFLLTVNPTTGQGNLTSVADPPAYTYEIKIMIDQ
jgi:hypothetical protein